MSEHTLSIEMAGLARDLHSAETPAAVLQRVVDLTTTLVAPCESAGISIATRKGQIRTSAATDDIATRADELQQSTRQGPCLDAVWEHELVELRDLREDLRWPEWAAVATEQLGVVSMVCLRLFTHEDVVGALNLFSPEPGAFGPDEVALGTAIAAHAAVAVVAAESRKNLRSALLHRSATSQAVGITMVKYGLSAEDAFGLIRQLSGNQHRKLNDVAQQIIEEQEALGHA
jgi:GAF domain-containing protein